MSWWFELMWLFAVVVMHMWFELMWLFAVVVMCTWFELMRFVVVALRMRLKMLMWMSLFVAHSRSLLSTIPL